MTNEPDLLDLADPIAAVLERLEACRLNHMPHTEAVHIETAIELLRSVEP